ncbi:MAG: tRNA pseudouridine synthase A [Bifidobacteriaceae bacterium]|nr:tRNA pseudouridine synthase A [Bifidobacteriaceae bacterium]
MSDGIVQEDVRLRLDLAYDGADFAGWAFQPGLRTVQGVVEEALGRALRLGGPAATVVAGRTDSGVHARAQVAHADIPAAAWDAWEPPTADAEPGLVRRLASALPADVCVRRAAPAPAGFDARFSALSRLYCYRICDRPEARDPLTRGSVLWHRRALDTGPMSRAAATLLGEHDFAAFAKPRPGASTVRTLQRLDVLRADDGVIHLWVQADAFCHNMVRALAGALEAVGAGRRGEDWPAQALAARRRDPAATVLPAHALTLERVDYPPDRLLAAQAVAARVFRGPADAAVPRPADAAASGPSAGLRPVLTAPRAPE